MNNLEPQSKLKLSRKIGYSLGHINNDMIAACFHSYIIVFVGISVGLNPSHGGYIIVIGQFTAAITCPIIGIIDDKKVCSELLGKRTIMYLAGLILITLGFGIAFNVTFDADDDSQLRKLLYFVLPVVMFASGYTFVQLTHLAVLTEITFLEKERIELNSWRNAATLVSNLIVYCGVWILLTVQTGDNDIAKLTSKDVGTFHLLSQIIIAVGLIASLAFCLLVRKHPLNCCCNDVGRNDYNVNTNDILVVSTSSKEYSTDSNENMEDGKTCNVSFTSTSTEVINKNIEEAIKQNFETIRRRSTTQRRKSVIFEPEGRKWLRKILKDAMFYEVAIIYSSAKFIAEVTQIFVPVYVTETLEMEKDAIGVLPLTVYVSGFGTSLLMEKLCRRFGLKKIFITGEILTLTACTWKFFITPNTYQQIYAAFVLFGAGQATLNVTSLAMITKLIGRHVNYSSAVFGILSFTEKTLKALFYLMVQVFNNCGVSTKQSSCSDFYRIVIVLTPGVTAFVALIAMLSSHVREIKSKGRNDTIRNVIKNEESEQKSLSGANWEITHL